ncbi:hypothetical protein [Calothrix sp. FACHB-168]|uniref:hypothetical protein n=1 Tax=Calothrix sp. FACHB-168 TaxID=2692780 RepID=UPI001A7E4AD6
MSNCLVGDCPRRKFCHKRSLLSNCTTRNCDAYGNPCGERAGENRPNYQPSAITSAFNSNQLTIFRIKAQWRFSLNP